MSPSTATGLVEFVAVAVSSRFQTLSAMRASFIAFHMTVSGETEISITTLCVGDVAIDRLMACLFAEVPTYLQVVHPDLDLDKTILVFFDLVDCPCISQ